MPYIGEFLGTMLLILLGDGVVANVLLNRSGFKGAGPVQITFAWGLAVMLPAYIFGASSGAHFNPALTIALAAGGMFPWSMVFGYCVAQMAGAFCGAVLMWLSSLTISTPPKTPCSSAPASAPSLPSLPARPVS